MPVRCPRRGEPGPRHKGHTHPEEHGAAVGWEGVAAADGLKFEEKKG